MASLYRQGLINGFAVRDLRRKTTIALDRLPLADNLIHVDLSTEEKVETFRQVADNDAVLKAMTEARPRGSYWIEITVAAGDDMPGVQGRMAAHFEINDLFRAHVVLWRPIDLGSKTSPVLALAAGEFVLDHVRACMKAEQSTVLVDRGILGPGFDEEFERFVTDSYLLVLMHAGGCIQTAPRASNALSFSEKRSVDRHRDALTRKQVLRRTEVAETVAFFLPFVPAARNEAPGESRTRSHHGYRQHEVRGYTRFLRKSGKIVQVRPFLRGDPSLGTVKKMLDVRT
jgi:hypothetical protein